MGRGHWLTRWLGIHNSAQMFSSEPGETPGQVPPPAEAPEPQVCAGCEAACTDALRLRSPHSLQATGRGHRGAHRSARTPDTVMAPQAHARPDSLRSEGLWPRGHSAGPQGLMWGAGGKRA